ncbi:hypothetical protein SBRCBS47491_005707 [Sporothrix bragantina]|uniref:F-box domain-containing protein n=1 Tax=Sporothrix bragantina TaxID=671064 RepID=A0ABP0BZ51_9PEZI
MVTSISASSSPATPEVASWQDVGYRCPRPGFFLGDDGSMSSSRVLASADELSPSFDMGRLGVLPLELLHQIVDDLAETDIRALVALRNCNRASAAVVDSFRDFATVAAFPRALGALVRLAPEPSRTAPAVTATTTPATSTPVSIRALAACLRTTSCASCLRQREESGEDASSEVPYGDYIYLLGPERVCYSCFRSQPEYMPVARFASAGNTELQQHRDLVDSQPHLTSIRVPPGRYGVLARLTQPVDLFDRRQVEAAEEALAAEAEDYNGGSSSSSSSSRNTFSDRPATRRDRSALGKRGRSPVPAKPTRPDPLRYACVIPGPYWVQDDASKASRYPTAASTIDRGYACRACAQTDRKTAGHTGWADPLARYTREGLERHVADPRFGGRVLKRRVGMTDIYEHDAPRQGHFPPPVEFGATADLARRYEAVILVPQGSVVGSRM